MPRKPLFEIDRKSISRLQRQLKSLEKNVSAELSKEMESMMEDVLRAAKKDTPVKTGRLRDSGRLEKTDFGATKKWEVKFGGISVRGKAVDYAAKVHFMDKQFLTVPFDKAKKSVLRDLHRRMDKLLESASRIK